MERTNSVANLETEASESDIELARAEYEAYTHQALSKDAFLRSKEIDKELRKAKKADSKPSFKILVLGAGDAGKTTLVRQLTMLHNPCISQSETDHFRHIIKDNALDAMKKLITLCQDREWPFPADRQESAMRVMGAQSLTVDLTTDIRLLWSSDIIAKAWRKRSKSHVPSNAEYIFDNLERISAPDYRPTEDDILRSRARTTGIVESRFESGGNEFVLLDVGGQRNERRKWAHFFDNVTAVMFLAALDEYDMVLEEDSSQNRMHEAIQLFASITKMSAFNQTTFILFLNKIDLFTKKIEEGKKCLRKTFPDYSGGPNAKAGANFILKKYEHAYSGKGKLYAHTTCALDRKNCDRVFAAVRDTLMEQSMKMSGLSL